MALTEEEIYKNLRCQKLKGSVASRIKNGERKRRSKQWNKVEYQEK